MVGLYSPKHRVDYASVSARVPKKVKQEFCSLLETEGTTPYRFLNEVIQRKIAGSSSRDPIAFNVEYDRKTDSFTWFANYDGGGSSVIASRINPAVAEEILRAFQDSIKIRENYIERQKKAGLKVAGTAARQVFQKRDKK